MCLKIKLSKSKQYFSITPLLIKKRIFAPDFGALAQLARAFDWQSKGHRFDSGMLHNFF